MNDPIIDHERLAAEADAVIAGMEAPAEAAPGAGQAAAPVSESWIPFTENLMPMVVLLGVPQWDLSKAEQRELCQSLGQCLDQLLPGGADGKYACWVRLVAAIGGITAARVIQHGKLPPFGPKLADAAEKTATPAAT